MKSVTDAVKGYRRLIPSMTALVEFEAVARLSSFTLAASELGLTQAAVSKQVGSLEALLQVRLFHRLHRSITLTSEGNALYLAVAESMQRIAGVFDRLSDGSEEREVVFNTTAAFSHFRVMPKLAELKRLHPQLKVRLITDMFTADLRHNEVDIAVRYGNGKWRDGTSSLLFHDEVFPVCSPAWLASNGPVTTLSELPNAKLIESDATSEGWMNWKTWYDKVGKPATRLQYTLRCSLYTDAIQAVLQGHGIALGWQRLVGPLVQSGALVRLTEISIKTSDGYFAVIPHGRTITPLTNSLIEWLGGDLPA